MPKPSLHRIFAIVAGVAMAACVGEEPLGPVDAQFAKGGEPGKPGGAEEAVQLLEYYIFQDASGGNFVHILAKGTFPRVNLNVVQDYIFNGIRDDDYSIFYEYTTFAPLPVGPEDVAVWDFDEISQAWHIDIPWNGETFYYDYSLPDPRVHTVFPDFPHTNIDGAGGDPYAFDVRFQEENGDYIDYSQPQGIILGGSEQHSIEMAQQSNAAFHGDVGTIYSYATYTTATAGEPVFIDQIVVDATSISCNVSTVRERVDGVKVTKQVTEVSLVAQVVLSSGVGEPLPSAWIDVMLASGTDGPDGQPTFFDSFTSTYDSGPWAEGWGVSARFENDQTEFPLRLAVPYVYATDLKNNMVYAPSLNNDGNGSDWATLNKDPITTPYTFPYAITAAFTVDCGH